MLYQRAAVRASLLYRLALAQTEDASIDPTVRRATWQRAVDSCHEVLRRLPANAEDQLRVRLRCLTRLQNGYLELGDTRQSLTTGQDLLQLLEAHLAPGDLRHAQVRAALGRAHLQQGELSEAARRLDESLAAFDRANGRAADARTQALLRRANVFVASGDLDDAVQLLLRDEGTCAKTLSAGSPTLAQLYTTLGSMLALQRRYADAKPRFDRALHEEVPQLEVGAVSAERLSLIVERLRAMFSSPADSRELVQQLDASTPTPRPASRPGASPDSFVSNTSQPVTARRVDATENESYPFAQIARGMSSVILCDAFVAQLEAAAHDNLAQQLVVVPDASLHRLPFEALVVDDRHGSDRAFLLDLDVATAYAPSLSVIARLQQLPLRGTDDRLVALTGGIRDHTTWGLDSLQHAEEESTAVRALALRQARRQAKSVAKAPFFWAPFVLLGPAD